ncbi:MAG: hypothetical protein H0Z39_03270 [Peptococcaceae bacterium]|nr:hypothetical protein [Peptococcaceae bacterium]
MEWNGIRIKTVILVFVVSLAVLLGCHWVYANYGYNQPLKQVLNDNPVVKSFTINDEGQTVYVTVRLNRVDNLMVTYRDLNQKVSESLGDRPYQLVIEDDRDGSLEQVYYRSHYAIHEAIMKGNFSEMVSVIERQASAVDADADVYVDSDNVYVQMDNGKHFLYAVVPRTAKALEGPQAGGGGIYVQGN